MAPITTLTFREEIEIGVMISSDERIIDYILAGKIDSSEIRAALREVVAKHGNCHPDEVLAEMTIQHIEECRGWF
jgi:predicted Zn-dependent protease with MMP-like domain